MTPDIRNPDRYRRQVSLPEIGWAGQDRLQAAQVLVVGVGGLGSVAAFYLAAAGVGRIGLLDHDTVDLSNLQRQILHATRDVGRRKVDSAAEKLRALNPDVKIEPRAERLTLENAAGLIAEWDFVLDATDNLEAKFLIAGACHLARKPYSHAGITRFYGQTLTVLPGRTACYRCVFQDRPPEEEALGEPEGPLGGVPGVIGSIQAAEAIKHIVGCGRLLTNRLLTFDALGMRFREVAVQRSADCPLCGGAG